MRVIQNCRTKKKILPIYLVFIAFTDTNIIHKIDYIN